MVDCKLKGILDNEGKSSSHDSRGSQSPRQKRITSLEILVQCLQNHLRFHRDLMVVEDLVGENNIEEEHGDEEEETMRRSQLQISWSARRLKTSM